MYSQKNTINNDTAIGVNPVVNNYNIIISNMLLGEYSYIGDFKERFLNSHITIKNFENKIINIKKTIIIDLIICHTKNKIIVWNKFKDYYISYYRDSNITFDCDNSGNIFFNNIQIETTKKEYMRLYRIINNS